jgi:hypothetical protein
VKNHTYSHKRQSGELASVEKLSAADFTQVIEFAGLYFSSQRQSFRSETLAQRGKRVFRSFSTKFSTGFVEKAKNSLWNGGLHDFLTFYMRSLVQCMIFSRAGRSSVICMPVNVRECKNRGNIDYKTAACAVTYAQNG